LLIFVIPPECVVVSKHDDDDYYIGKVVEILIITNIHPSHVFHGNESEKVHETLMGVIVKYNY
jgi:hypothetical protein